MLTINGLSDPAVDDRSCPSVPMPVDVASDAAADVVWTTAEYLPGNWVDLGARSAVADLRSSLEVTQQALQREEDALTTCSSYWGSLAPPANPVPRNFSWTTSAGECGIYPPAESAPNETQPFTTGATTSPVRAFGSRSTLRSIRVRDAQKQARRIKVDAFKMAARKDSRLKTTFSSCSELHGGSEICTPPRRRGSEPTIFSTLSATPEPCGSRGTVVQGAAFARRVHEQPEGGTVQLTTHVEDEENSEPVRTAPDITLTWRERPAKARMSAQFRAWQKWSDRNARSTSTAMPGLPKTPGLARARGRLVAARAQEKIELAVEKQSRGSLLWKARTGALKDVCIVHLERSGVTDEKAKFLGEELAFIDPGRPVHVLLSENWIGKAGSAAIAEGLAASNCTTRVNLSQNRIGGAGAGHFSKLITPASELRSLDLSDNPLGLASFLALSDALAKPAKLRVLRLDRTGAGVGGALEALAAALTSSDCTLRGLSLRRNAIRGLGACVLAEALSENNCLHSLELGNNSISEAPLADGSAGAATRFGVALQENTTLRWLDLTHNNIGDEGAQELASALEHNKTLQKLVLSENLNITSAGCASFIKAKQLGWVDDIVVTAAAGGDDTKAKSKDLGGLDALVGGAEIDRPKRPTSIDVARGASLGSTLSKAKLPEAVRLTVELAGCFTKGNIPASLLKELGML